VSDNLTNNQSSLILIGKAVAAVAIELSIARRNWIAYPPGHPVIETSLKKLLTACCNLLRQQSPVQIGVTRDGLLLGENFVEKGNIVCRTVATVFFERGAGTLLVRHEPAPEELRALLRLLTMKREEILGEGGIEALWKALAISFLEVHGIRYDRFSGTEESVISPGNPDGGDTAEAGSTWERFVRLMMLGDAGFEGADTADDIRPEMLAAYLNDRFAQHMGAGGALSSSALRNSCDLMREILSDRALQDTATEGQPVATDERTGSPGSSGQAGLRSFIAALDPALRRHILDGFCETTDDADSGEAEEFFRCLGPEMLQSAYATAEEYSAAPPLLQSILRKLAPHMVDVYETATPQDEIRDKVRVLLQEHLQEAYIPDDYLQGLKDLLAENPLPQIENSRLEVLMSSVEPAAVEIHGSEIIMQLVVTDPDVENTQLLISNLADMCGQFLVLGDYGQVLKILRQAAASGVAPHVRMALRDAFSRREFLDEILSGLTVWGKPKYDQVTLLIRVIGKPFIEPLLDRLAEEDKMSLRRFMMDRLLAFGDAARPALVARLADRRWFVLRNIIIMLRTLAPGQEVEALRPLLKHANQKVRQEVVRSLLLAGDPIAQRQVLRDLDSSDRETQLAALHMAGRSCTTEMAWKLAKMLSAGGYTQPEYELKLACVQALAEIGKPEVLPELGKVLGARSLLAYKVLIRLKLDIVKSLERYPTDAALPLLEQLVTGRGELSDQAAESLKNLRSRPS